jgi:ankyrin repeat protein
MAGVYPDDARTLSVSLFRAMETLAHADAHLHAVYSVHSTKAEADITTTLFHASQVAHSLCESALARVEPFYDAHTEGILAADSAFCSCSCSCSCSCRSFVSSALKNADAVSMALEYASENVSSVALQPVSWCCGDEATRAAIDAGDLGAISLAVVLLLELPRSSSSPLQLVHHAMRKSKSNTEPAVITRIIRLLLLVPAIAASATDADTHGNTALMLASANGHAEAVTALLACPTVVQSLSVVTTNGKNTALMLASANGHAEIVATLLACPIVVQNAGAANQRNFTALMLASQRGHIETVTALLASPIVIQSAGAVDLHGDTALMIASRNGHTETVNALLACPPIVQSAGVGNTYGNTALMIALAHGHKETVNALLACPPVVQSAGAVNSYGDTALMLACIHGHSETVATLLACPQVIEFVDACNKNGDTALDFAQRHKNDAIIELLSSFNVDE